MSRAALVSSFVLLLAACGAAEPGEERASNASHDGRSNGGDRVAERDSTPDDSTPDDSAAADSAADELAREEAARTAACPSTFGAPGPSCEGEHANLSCSYPEGECYCGEPRRCSGAALPPQPPTWNCIPREPPCPPVGTACREGEVGCSPWCCGMAVVCVNGVWTSQPVPCPP